MIRFETKSMLKRGKIDHMIVDGFKLHCMNHYIYLTITV